MAPIKSIYVIAPFYIFFSLSFLLVFRLPQNKFCVQYFSTHAYLYHLSFISCCCSVVILLAGSGGRPFVHALTRLIGFPCVVIVQSASLGFPAPFFYIQSTTI